MWPMGHVAIAYLSYVGSTRLRAVGRPAAGPILLVCFGALVPDLVDKPLGWYTGVLPTGRSLTHSLLVLVALALVVYLLLRGRDRGEYGLAFGVGAISHPLADALPVLWSPDATASFLLWPFLTVEPYEGAVPNPFDMLLATLSEPYFLAEFVLFGLALALWRADGYPGLSVLRQAVRERTWPQTG